MDGMKNRDWLDGCWPCVLEQAICAGHSLEVSMVGRGVTSQSRVCLISCVKKYRKIKRNDTGSLSPSIFYSLMKQEVDREEKKKTSSNVKRPPWPTFHVFSPFLFDVLDSFYSVSFVSME